MDFDRLQQAVGAWASELGLEAAFFQTNAEGEFVEHLHRLDGIADAILLNPGAWTHYSWAIRDALEIASLRPSRCISATWTTGRSSVAFR